MAEFLGQDEDSKQKDIHIDEVTEDWLLAWSNWLRENGSRSVNTLHRRMAFMNTIFIDARKRRLTKNNPMAFLTFKQQRTRKNKLTWEQVTVLENLELSGHQEDARNTFLLQFYAWGLELVML